MIDRKRYEDWGFIERVLFNFLDKLEIKELDFWKNESEA